MMEEGDRRGSSLRAFFAQVQGLDYLVLRGYASLPDSYSGHDIDILATEAALDHIRDTMDRIRLRYGWSLYRHERRQQLEEWVLWANHETLVIQVSWSVDWHGCQYLDPEEVLRSTRQTDRDIPIPDPDHEAFISAFSWLLWGSAIRPVYYDQLTQLRKRNPSWLSLTLARAFGSLGQSTVEEVLDNGDTDALTSLASSLRRYLTLQTLRQHPIEVLRGKLTRWKRGVTSAARLQGGGIAVTMPPQTDHLWEQAERVLSDCFRGVEVERVTELEAAEPRMRDHLKLALRQSLRVYLVQGQFDGSFTERDLVNEILKHFLSPVARARGLLRVRTF